jgi:hypothetical protein
MFGAEDRVKFLYKLEPEGRTKINVLPNTVSYYP